ncbi:VOC family protein [Pseudaminobacter soli (ex Li et al. 2025)]|uniref:Glyoxalase n=1 Tax=Pseudaminobacter soli (ex Li et al. 2025) TaxID=1295366 RepID=A0A2P7SFZ8_9HYPH|nr:VOC family protein [Mesorhizobium soli]PSJ61305.1 glyoxalase [Mesorhizobium soli]
MPAKPSKFVWYELMTSDVDAAEKFYKTVVGWNSEQWGGGDEMHYVIMKAGDAGVAGLMAIPDEAAGMNPAWVGYIYAADVDAETESVRKDGGKVFRAPADIPEVGRFSVVTDPQGAVFMLFTPKGEGGASAAQMTPGHIGWHELLATDWKSAFDFYSKHFQWSKGDAVDMGPMGTYQLFTAGGDAIGGMMTKPPQIPSPYWLYYFNVADIDEAVERVLKNKGQVVMGPMEVPGGAWIVQGIDPQGALFALVGSRK